VASSAAVLGAEDLVRVSSGAHVQTAVFEMIAAHRETVGAGAPTIDRGGAPNAAPTKAAGALGLAAIAREVTDREVTDRDPTGVSPVVSGAVSTVMTAADLVGSMAVSGELTGDLRAPTADPIVGSAGAVIGHVQSAQERVATGSVRIGRGAMGSEPSVRADRVLPASATVLALVEMAGSGAVHDSGPAEETGPVVAVPGRTGLVRSVPVRARHAVDLVDQAVATTVGAAGGTNVALALVDGAVATTTVVSTDRTGRRVASVPMVGRRSNGRPTAALAVADSVDHVDRGRSEATASIGTANAPTVIVIDPSGPSMIVPNGCLLASSGCRRAVRGSRGRQWAGSWRRTSPRWLPWWRRRSPDARSSRRT
jgi:hypothetical protein